MKKFTTGFIAFLLFLSFGLKAQTPVHWSFEVKSLGGNEYNLVFHAKIDKGWAVYSQHVGDDGPVPTSFEFEDGAHFAKVGAVSESGHKKSGFDQVFKMEITKFVEDGIFTQKVKVTDFTKPITGYLTFMTCNDKTCLPPTDVDFSFSPQPAKQAPIEPKKKTPTPVKKEVTKTPKAKPNPTPQKKQVTPTPKTKTKKQPKKQASIPPPVPVAPPAPVAPAAPKQDAKLPVQWTWESKKINETEFDIIFKAKIKEHWGLYSQTVGEDGPLPTAFTFDEENATAKGLAKESDNRITKFDKVFEMDVSKFKEYAVFTQRVTVKDPTQPVKGYIDYMTCDDSKCMNQQLDFSVGLNGKIANTFAAESSKHFKGYFETKRDINAEVTLSNCGGTGDTGSNDKSLWVVFLLGLAGGLFALLTPCVFPLIPLTVSYFTKGGTDKKKGVRDAMIYGLAIIFIYVSMGTVLTSIFGPTILNDMATNVYMNVLFFVLFVIFAISFFGVFEITLPSSWANKSDRAADQGGLIGIFFMAFTLAIVSFSCTGPIIGSLLVQSASGANALFGIIPVQPLVGMFGFSLALALPFTLFAMFPAWLNNLPKSGSWMNNVKVTLGFLELALALKFLSVADMVKHWGILKFELFMVLWILIFLGLGLYHLGVFRFKGESKKRPGIFRLALGIASLLFVGYMAKGLYNYQSLSLLSGLAPPVHYNYFGEQKECPYDLNCFHDFDEALVYAKEVNKPVFVDFTGYGCVNCRKMEEHVWKDEKILKHLQENYVVVSLYVDDKERLFPDNKQAFLLDRNNGQKLRTIGSKWAAFEVNNFGKSSQPYYVLMDNDGKTLLNKPVPYTPDVEAYKAFLDCGLTAFKNK